VFDRVDFDVALGERSGTVRLGDIFHARLDFRLAVEIHAAETHAAVSGRGQDGHVDPVAAVEADAGKRRRAIERLLIEHARLNKTRGQLARLQIGR